MADVIDTGGRDAMLPTATMPTGAAPTGPAGGWTDPSASAYSRAPAVGLNFWQQQLARPNPTAPTQSFQGFTPGYSAQLNPYQNMPVPHYNGTQNFASAPVNPYRSGINPSSPGYTMPNNNSITGVPGAPGGNGGGPGPLPTTVTYGEQSYTPQAPSSADVMSAYQQYLGRAPTAAELANGTSRIDYRQLTNNLLTSPEFTKAHPAGQGAGYLDPGAAQNSPWINDANWRSPTMLNEPGTGSSYEDKVVSQLYQNYLGRAPDAAGLDYWAHTGLNTSELEAAFKQAGLLGEK